MRKDLLVTGQTYHVFSRSIAGFVIFNNEKESSRIVEAMRYYLREKPDIKFSRYLEMRDCLLHAGKDLCSGKENLVAVIAYCVMPTHLHVVVKQLKENGVSIFMGNTLNSYTRYFNTKHERRGPLWETKFKNVLVENDDYLLHLTRYVHLNPVTAELVDKPEDWHASSYKEYLSQVDNKNSFCIFNDLVELKASSYRQFVEDRISYQRDLAKIRLLVLD